MQVNFITMLPLKSGQRYLFVLFTMLLGSMGLLTSFAGCSKAATPVSPVVVIPPTDSSNGNPTGPLKYLALGDSYTIGQSVPESDRFPVQMSGMITGAGRAVESPVIIARTGWRTTDLLQAIDDNKPASNYDIVTLLIGVNDEYQSHDTSGYRDRFTSCLTKAIQLAAGKANHVFVVSIPDYSVTPFGGNSALIAKEIDMFNAINLSVTNSFGVSYTDVTVISRNVKYDTEMICSDGLHPSGKQYQLWATKIAGNIQKQLK